MYVSRQTDHATEKTSRSAAENNSPGAKKAPAVSPPLQLLDDEEKPAEAKFPLVQPTPADGGLPGGLKPGVEQPPGGRQRSADPADRITQFKLENTRINKDLTVFQSAVETYASLLSNAVEEAHSIIATKYFVHVPTADGYMQNFLDNFNAFTNKFIDNAAVPRQAGYWIESYVTKIAKPSAGGLDIILQAKRGNSRPDVILQYKGTDIAWLDITSTVSEGHIYDKNSEGWKTTPYVTEVTYSGLKVIDLNKIDIPDAKSKDLSKLIERANEAKAKQLEWEAQVIEKKGFALAQLLHGCYWYIKKCAVEEVDEMDEEEFDKSYSPFEKGNKFEQWAIRWVRNLTGKQIDARELASLMMYWNGMLIRYVKRFNNIQLPSEFNLPTKENLGLSWVDDSSSSDGEPVIRELFPV